MKSRIKNRQLSEERELQLLERVLPSIGERSLAIDGGANVGLWTRVMAREFRKVIAFEPVDFSFVTLCEQTATLPNVYPMCKALFDRACNVAMNHPPKRTTSTAYYAEPQEIADTEAITVDSLVVADCNLLKLDLEGAELRALIGAKNTLARCRPLVIVECIDKQLMRYGDSADELHRWMRKHSYRLMYEQVPNRVYLPC